MSDAPSLKIVGGTEKSNEALRAELEALRYENQKLKTINDVLVTRVEMGWGNFSAAYSSFQQAAGLGISALGAAGSLGWQPFA